MVTVTTKIIRVSSEGGINVLNSVHVIQPTSFEGLIEVTMDMFEVTMDMIEVTVDMIDLTMDMIEVSMDIIDVTMDTFEVTIYI